MGQWLTVLLTVSFRHEHFCGNRIVIINVWVILVWSAIHGRLHSVGRFVILGSLTKVQIDCFTVLSSDDVVLHL